jgi:hypothetical protein
MMNDGHSEDGSPILTISVRLEQQVEAVMHELDPNLVGEYFNACEIVPNLVRTESRITDFLRTEQQHVQKAAERLARYWKVRKENFGDRWLLPMNQTGSGALTSEQIEVLRSGFLTPVTNTGNDCPVIFCDFSLLPKKIDTIYHPCVLMYLLTHLPGDLRGLFIVRSSWGKFCPTINPDVQKVFGCTATTFKSTHIVRAYEEGREYLLDYLTYRQTRLNEKVMNQSSVVLAGNSTQSTLQLLMDAGFHRNYVPHILGGNLHDQLMFTEWVRGRLSQEIVTIPSPILSIASDDHTSQSNALTTTSKSSRGTVVQRKKEWVVITKRPDESEDSFRKRRNALYVKRSYHRRKLELTALEGQAAHAKTMNEALKSEHMRLLLLLKEAKIILNDVTYTA